MNLNDIKKALYIQKPTAILEESTDTNLVYSTIINQDYRVEFNIPIEETKRDDGVNLFHNTMEAKYLIRWIVE